MYFYISITTIRYNIKCAQYIEWLFYQDLATVDSYLGTKILSKFDIEFWADMNMCLSVINFRINYKFYNKTVHRKVDTYFKNIFICIVIFIV